MRHSREKESSQRNHHIERGRRNDPTVGGDVCWLVVQRPSYMLVHLRGVFGGGGGGLHDNFTCCHTEIKLQIKLSISPNPSILTPDQPVSVLTL